MEGVDDGDRLLLHTGYITGLKGMGVDDVWLNISNYLFKLLARQVIFDGVYGSAK